jgi:hypothetical protein
MGPRRLEDALCAPRCHARRARGRRSSEYAHPTPNGAGRKRKCSGPRHRVVVAGRYERAPHAPAAESAYPHEEQRERRCSPHPDGAEMSPVEHQGCCRERWSARRSNALVPVHCGPGADLQDNAHGRRIDGERSPERRARPRPVVKCLLATGQGCTI